MILVQLCRLRSKCRRILAAREDRPLSFWLKEALPPSINWFSNSFEFLTVLLFKSSFENRCNLKRSKYYENFSWIPCQSRRKKNVGQLDRIFPTKHFAMTKLKKSFPQKFNKLECDQNHITHGYLTIICVNIRTPWGVRGSD